MFLHYMGDILIFYYIYINMENRIKKKLKRRGKELSLRYLGNSIETQKLIIEQYDKNIEIDENKCEIIFDLSVEYEEKIYELNLFYPKLIRKYRVITKEILDEIYEVYGETIDIMKNNRKGKLNSNPRGKICMNAASNSKKNGCYFNITSEDIKLVKFCPILDIELDYNNSKICDNSPSIDKIIPSLGYVKDNIQIISVLANKMKSNATPEQLIKFSKKMLELYA